MADGLDAETNLRIYLRGGAATDAEIDRFMEWCHIICNGGAGNATSRRRRYCCYRLWAKLLRKRRTPYRRDDVFDFKKVLKQYIRSIAEGDIADAPPPARAIIVPCKNFVKYVVRYLDEAL
jgi:hypothetical protein